MGENVIHQLASDVRKYILLNDIAELKTILNKKPKSKKKKISDCNVNGLNALHKSVQLDRSDIVRYLIEECHADPNSLSDSEQAPLELAGINANLDMMKYLHRHGADIHRQNKNGETYLMQFIKNSPICEFLLSEGVDVNIKDLNKRSALAHAVEENCVRSVELLAKYGVNVNENLSSGINSVAFACCHGKLDMLEILCSCGADINSRDDEGCNYMMQSVHQPNICKFLLHSGLNVNDVNKKNKTTLCFAAEKGKLDTMETLLNSAADVNIADNDGNTALHYAVEASRLEQVKLLVNHGADLNKRNDLGLIPIYRASMKGLSGIVDYLAQNVQIPTTKAIDAYELLAAEAFKKYRFQHGKQFILKALDLRESIHLVTKSPTTINEIFGEDGKEPEVNKVQQLEADLNEKLLEIDADQECDIVDDLLSDITSQHQERLNAYSPTDVSTILRDNKKTMLIQAALIQARIISPCSEAVFQILQQLLSLADTRKEKYRLEIRRVMVDIAIQNNPKNNKCVEGKHGSKTCSYSKKVCVLLKSYLLNSLKYDPTLLNFTRIVQYLKLFLDYFQHAWLYHNTWIADGHLPFDLIAVFAIYKLFMMCSSKDEEKQVQDLVHRLLLIGYSDVKLVNDIHRIYFGMRMDDAFRGLSTPAMLSLLEALSHEGMDVTCKNERNQTVLERILSDLIDYFDEVDYYKNRWNYWDMDHGDPVEWTRRNRDNDTSKLSELIEFLLNAGISLFGMTKVRGRINTLGLIRLLPNPYRRRYYCVRKETSLQCLAAKVVMKTPEQTYATRLPRHLTTFIQIHSGSKCCKKI